MQVACVAMVLALVACSTPVEITDAGDAMVDGASDADVGEVSPPPPRCDEAGAPCANDAGATVQATWSFGDNGQTLTINRCDSVQWTNTDNGTPHSVVGLTGCFFDTGTNFGGAYAPVRFSTTGTFPYFCSVHATTMKGTLVVQ